MSEVVNMKIKFKLFKHCITTAFLGMLITTAFCQKPLAVYYLNKYNYILPNISTAEYILLIMPPDTSADKKLFEVKEYYANGKLKYISSTTSLNIQDTGKKMIGFAEPILQGGYISYFQNGHKMEIAAYENGKRTGGEIQFYPNGKLYCTKTYTKDGKALYVECRDSTGKVLFENGNGSGTIFLDDNFKNYLSGNVIDGLPQGEWHGKQSDTTNTVGNYKDGDLKSEFTLDKSGRKLYLRAEINPEFPGGPDGFVRFLSRTVRYPAVAREENRQGRVIISFVLNEDGTLSDFVVAKSVSKEIDAEAIRVLKISPKWKPAMVNGQPVRIGYSMPIGFTLSTEN